MIDEEFGEVRDVEIRCFVCDQLFVWSASEQQFYRDRNLSPPKRCRPCRDRKRAINYRVEKDTENFQRAQAELRGDIKWIGQN